MPSDANVLMLTPLKRAGHNFKIATRPGSWIVAESSLSELGDALEVAEDARVDLVRSTPDPWAQVRSFADVFLDTVRNDDAVIGQWRALITILALAALKENAYRIELEPVVLKPGSSRFADVMLKLLPRISLPFKPAPDGRSMGWDSTVVMRVVLVDAPANAPAVSQPLALLNPACLIAPGRDAEKWTLPIGWMKEGLIDPLTARPPNGLSPSELHALAQYLDNLKDRLGSLCDPAGNGSASRGAFSGLMRRIDDFASDVRSQPGFAEVDEGLAFELGDAPDERLPAPYRLLTTPIRDKAPAAGKSQCLIPLRDDIGDAPFAGLVLLDKDLAGDQRPATSIRFWGNRTLQQVLDMRPAERKALAEEIGKAGYLLVTPDDFFTEAMVRLNDEDRPGRMALHPDGLGDRLLPLSPLALLVLTPQEIAERIELGRNGRLTLRIKLDGRSHVMARTYEGDRQLLDKIDWLPGEFAVWPDFRSPRWQHYAARFEYARTVNDRLRGRFALSGALLAHQLRHVQQHADRAALASLWASSKPLDPRQFAGKLDPIPTFADRQLMQPEFRRLRARDMGSIVSEIQISTLPFEAAFFTVSLGTDQPPVPVGMALLDIKPVDGSNPATGDVAVDFGTTNTVACINEETPAKLNARIVHPVQQAGGTVQSRGQLGQGLREFLPPDDRPLPTPTVLINRELDTAASALLEDAANSGLESALLIRQLIYFQPDFASDGTITSVGINDWTTLLGRLRFNLKWSQEPDAKLTAQRYIRQLIMMLSAEWAADNKDPKNLRWHFSRPNSMGTRNDKDFTELLGRGLDDAIPGRRPNALAELAFEGDAAAAYILKDDPKRTTTKGKINIILDIGGGTTDIAVWTGGMKPRRLYSRSLRLAGGDFFTGHITDNPEILSEFGLKPWAQIVSQLNQQTDIGIKDNVRYVGELLFSGKTLGEAIDNKWSLISGTDRIRHLKETTFLFLAGVAWHIGVELRSHIAAGDLAAEDLRDIAVALCGRGSGFFTRLHGKDPHAQTDVARLLRLIAVGAMDTRPAWPQVQISEHPKIEVAAGMIIMGKAAAGRTPIQTTAEPEEDDDFGAAFDDNAQLAGAVADGEGGGYTIAAPEIGEPEFEKFLKAFAIASRCTIELSDFQRRKLKNRAAELHGIDEAAGRDPQSEFADLLKAMVEMMRNPPDSPVKPKTIWR